MYTAEFYKLGEGTAYLIVQTHNTYTLELAALNEIGYLMELGELDELLYGTIRQNCEALLYYSSLQGKYTVDLGARYVVFKKVADA